MAVFRFFASCLRPVRSRRRSRRLASIEICERRVVPAGNVTAVIDGLDLVITGDDSSNSVQVVFAGGDVIVRGLDGTTINGGAGPFVAFAATNTTTGSVRIETGKGHDVIHLRDVVVTNDIDIDSGSGNDRIGVENITADSVEIASGKGTDRLLIEQLTTTDSVTVIDEAGRSMIVFDNANVTGDLGVLTANGADVLAFVTVTVTDNIFVRTGNGNDTLVLNDLLADGLTLDTGSGSDAVLISSLDTTDATRRTDVQLGTGTDYLVVMDGTLQAPLTLDGGPGANRLLLVPGVQTPNGSTVVRFNTLLDTGLFPEGVVLKRLSKVSDDFLEFADFIHNLP